MVNKKFLLGMLVMVLAFGLTVVGCEIETDFYYKVQNDSSFKINKVDFIGINNAGIILTDTDGIAAGSSKTYTFGEGEDNPAGIEITVTINGKDETAKLSSLGNGATAGEKDAKVIVLTGKDKDSLQISLK